MSKCREQTKISLLTISNHETESYVLLIMVGQYLLTRYITRNLLLSLALVATVMVVLDGCGTTSSPVPVSANQTTSTVGYPTPTESPTASFNEYPVLTQHSLPEYLVSGPDGNLWFTEGSALKIGKIAPDGQVREYAVNLPGATQSNNFGYINDITVGPDKKLWFTASAGNAYIGRISTSGAITLFSVAASEGVDKIAKGPDGNLWTTEFSGNKIGRYTINTRTYTEYSVTPHVMPSLSVAVAIVTGNDGNLWFTDYARNKIGRISAKGTVKEFAIPTPNSLPSDITVGADGDLWFTEYGVDQIGRISLTGTITEFHLSARSSPYGITTGSDGNVWFTEFSGDRIGRITPVGVVSEYAIPTSNSGPVGIAMGPDSHIWFAERSANKVTRLDLNLA
jgi:virginiamycin B lyase